MICSYKPIALEHSLHEHCHVMILIDVLSANIKAQLISYSHQER